MSLKSYSWAWSMPVQSSSERLVLLALSERSNKEFMCWPSQKCIAEDTRMNIKTVGSALKKLTEKSFILEAGKRQSRNGFVKVYRLNTAFKPQQKRMKKGLENSLDTHSVQGVKMAFNQESSHPNPTSEQTPDFEATDTQNCLETGNRNRGTEPLTYEPLNNPIKKVYKKKFSPKSNHFDFSKLPKSVDQSAVQNFIDHRQALNAPLTQHALEIQMREAAQAASIGLSPADVIDQTIGAGWKSINLTWLQNRTQPKDLSANQSCWETYDPFDTSWLRAEDLEMYVHGD